jgi:hypothetical protein
MIGARHPFQRSNAMPRLPLDVKEIQTGILNRWGPRDWDVRFPWWGKPAKVRILIYADGGAFLVGGSFLGLQYVYNLLKSRAYSYVSFEVDFVHRDGADPSATIAGAKKLTDLDVLNKYDEIWFFGTSSVGDLDPAEHTLLDQFMSAPKAGGVLVTGDHANLGKRLAGQVKRAGKMRLYPAPDSVAPGWNTTLVEGPDAGTTYDFNEQSDDTPQVLRLRKYSLMSPLALFPRRYRPHPVMCGPDGPIDVFADHQHEGEALAPAVAAADPDWPIKAGHQEKPEVIAWGRIKDPAATKAGQEIGVLSAYNGHNVDVGRILADSTWHHWFDINITGVAAPPSPYAGFDATPAGQAVLKQLDAFFLNVGVWLAPPARQAAMRAAAWWSILWTDRVLELPSKASILYLGEQAIDALGSRASRCAITEWVFDWPIFKEKIPRWEWPQVLDRFQLINLPLEHYVAGGVLKRLNLEVGPASGRPFPSEAIDPRELDRLMAAGAEDGLSAFAADLGEEAARAARLAESNFDLRALSKAADRKAA